MDMTKTTAPKSTQLNADDLIGGRSLTITITKVTEGPGKDQPVEIHYAGGLPYLPCKSMRRVLIHLWGPDGSKYVGRSLTLFCDPTVKFGGVEVGGIRISHASHIDKAQTMALTATKGARKAFTVKPLAGDGTTLDDFVREIETAVDLNELKALLASASKLAKTDADRTRVAEAKDKRKAELSNPNPMEGVK